MRVKKDLIILYLLLTRFKSKSLYGYMKNTNNNATLHSYSLISHNDRVVLSTNDKRIKALFPGETISGLEAFRLVALRGYDVLNLEITSALSDDEVEEIVSLKLGQFLIKTKFATQVAALAA